MREKNNTSERALFGSWTLASGQGLGHRTSLGSYSRTCAVYLHMCTHTILTAIICIKHLCYLHFIDEKTKEERNFI
jgi:hypothetical protein